MVYTQDLLVNILDECQMYWMYLKKHYLQQKAAEGVLNISDSWQFSCSLVLRMENSKRSPKRLFGDILIIWLCLQLGDT